MCSGTFLSDVILSQSLLRIERKFDRVLYSVAGKEMQSLIWKECLDILANEVPEVLSIAAV